MSNYDLAKSYADKITQLNYDFEYQVEAAKLDVTEAIVKLMNDRHVSKSELAAMMQKTPGFVTKLLSGENNFTVQTLTAIGLALKHRVSFQFTSIEKSVGFSLSQVFHKSWESAAPTTISPSTKTVSYENQRAFAA